MPISSNSNSRRLVTQNLLVSSVSHELTGGTNWQSIHDLSVLIETFCLYDEIVVLGRQAYSMLRSLENQSEIFKVVDNIVRVEEPASSTQLVQTACGHLSAFLNERTQVERFQPLIETLFEPDWVTRAFRASPEQIVDFKSGEEWVRTVPNETNIVQALERDPKFHRSTTFVLRTFLYLAYADIHQVRLTPDMTRSGVLEPIIRSEKQLRKQLLTKMEEGFQQNYLGNDEVRRNITPLASVVFDRATKAGDIPDEMLRLRRELTPLRERLGNVESVLKGATRETELKIVREWDGVFQEIERKHGAGAGFVSVEGALTFAEAAGKLATKPHDLATWFKPLGLPIEAIRKMFVRRPVIEIHRLQFPSTAKLTEEVRNLFGDVLKEP